jgi:hypothetical protein
MCLKLTSPVYRPRPYIRWWKKQVHSQNVGSLCLLCIPFSICELVSLCVAKINRLVFFDDWFLSERIVHNTHMDSLKMTGDSHPFSSSRH